MKTLRFISQHMEIRRDPQGYIQLNTKPWLIQTSSMLSDTGGITPPWYSTGLATVLMDEDWTEAEAITYMRAFRNKGIVLELEDDVYDSLTARIRNGSILVSSEVQRTTG